MKYGSIKEADSKQFRIPYLNGGINLNDEEFIEDNQLSSCSNMWFKNGALRTRLGIGAVEGSVVGRYDEYSQCIIPFKMTDSSVYLDGKQYAIAYCLDGDYVSYELLRVFLVSGEGEIRETAPIYLRRTSEELFYRFSNAVFFSAASSDGGGIYIFMTVWQKDEEYYRIYEINSDLSGWQQIYSSQCYTPIIYMNGRGASYPENDNELIYYSAKPTEPEALNMLNPTFKAYFTSDNFSSVFKLPVTELDNSSVICRVYVSPYAYGQWAINEGETTSTIIFNSVSVELSVDRASGILTFTSGGAPYPIPYMALYGGNNMEITAHKTVENAFDRVVGSKRVVGYNSRLYFCGNKYKPDEVYSVRTSSPLYFPINSKVSVGDRTSPVTALGVVCNKLIAFKPNEIYKINVTVGDSYTPEGILSVKKAGFMHNDTLTTTAVHTSIGCDCPETLKNCSNRLVWLSSTGKVYTLATTTYGKENNIFSVSANIENFLKSFNKDKLKKIYAADTDGYYMLVFDKRIAVMDYRIKDFGFPAKYAGENENGGAISWYMWDYCVELDEATVTKVDGNVLFACNSEDLKYQYISRLQGEKDVIIKTDEEGAPKLFEYGIESGFTTRSTDFGLIETLKTLDSIYMGLKLTGQTEISVMGERCGGDITLLPKTEKYEVTRINLPIKSANRIKISAVSKDSFAAGGILIKYRNI
ncbi:MAG: hypothetical protein IJZ75_00250 [Clostridia bacterium]|nr:hypothetical protein [Clostridia bacterium]